MSPLPFSATFLDVSPEGNAVPSIARAWQQKPKLQPNDVADFGRGRIASAAHAMVVYGSGQWKGVGSLFRATQGILPREGDVLERTGYYGAHAWNAGGGARGGNPLHGLRAGKDQRVRGL